MAMSWIKSVKVMEVIRVESVIGKGYDGDPLRPVVEFFDLKGNALDMGDYTHKEKPHDPA